MIIALGMVLCLVEVWGAGYGVKLLVGPEDRLTLQWWGFPYIFTIAVSVVITFFLGFHLQELWDRYRR